MCLISRSELGIRCLAPVEKTDRGARASPKNSRLWLCLSDRGSDCDCALVCASATVHSRSWSRGESRRPICFVTANARLLLLFVLLRIRPSRYLLRRLRRRRPQCSSIVFRTTLSEERPIRTFDASLSYLYQFVNQLEDYKLQATKFVLIRSIEILNSSFIWGSLGVSEVVAIKLPIEARWIRCL